MSANKVKKGKLSKNIGYQLVYQAVVLLSPLLVTPYLSRVLGPTQLGKYSYGYSIAYYFVLFGTLGITAHGSRQIAAVKDDEEKLNEEFSNLFWLHTVSASLVTLVYAFCIFKGINSDYTISLIFLLYVASTIFDVKWLFYGLENFKITVMRSLIIKFISIISIFLFVRNRSDINTYTLIMAGISFFLAEISLYLLFPKYVKLKKPKWSAIKYEIIPLVVMFVPTAASLICRHIDKVMLGMMSSLDQVGLYENVDKVYLMLVAVITTIGDVMLPRMSNLFARGDKEKANQLLTLSLRVCIISACAFMFGISSIAKEFVPVFFGKEFMGCIKLLIYISPTILMLAFSATIRKQYLVPRYKNNVFVISMLLGTIINILANCFFIPQYGAIGAVYGTIIAEFVIVVIQIAMTWKSIDYIPFFKDTIIFCVFGVVMFLLVRSVEFMKISSVFIRLILEIMIGSCVYIGLTYLYMKKIKDPILQYLKSFLHHKLLKK